MKAEPPEELRVDVFRSHADAEAHNRRVDHARTMLERTMLLEELRRALYPEEYKNPPTVLEPLVVVPVKRR